MKVYDKLIHVSKASISTKIFEIPEEELSKLSEEELKKVPLPTPEEAEFMEVYKSNISQLARLQRKMSVCLDVEVTKLEEDSISYEYAGSIYTANAPKNAFRICAALEKGKLDALVEMEMQGCIFKDEIPMKDIRKDGAYAVDEILLLSNVVDKFFFQTFLHF